MVGTRELSGLASFLQGFAPQYVKGLKEKREREEVAKIQGILSGGDTFDQPQVGDLQQNAPQPQAGTFQPQSILSPIPQDAPLGQVSQPLQQVQPPPKFNAYDKAIKGAEASMKVTNAQITNLQTKNKSIERQMEAVRNSGVSKALIKETNAPLLVELRKNKGSEQALNKTFNSLAKDISKYEIDKWKQQNKEAEKGLVNKEEEFFQKEYTKATKDEIFMTPTELAQTPAIKMATLNVKKYEKAKQNAIKDAADKKQKLFVTEMPDLRKDMKASKDVMAAVTDLEEVIGKDIPGFNLDTYDPKKHDIPGVTIPFLGIRSPIPGRAVKNAVQEILNKKIYLASGKQINEKELERLSEALGAKGVGQSEEILFEGLKRYKKELERGLIAVRASYDPDVVAEFERRLGGGGYQPPSQQNQLSKEDQDAYDWAIANPNAPESAEILKELGVN